MTDSDAEVVILLSDLRAPTDRVALPSRAAWEPVTTRGYPSLVTSECCLGGVTRQAALRGAAFADRGPRHCQNSHDRVSTRDG